MSYMSFVNFYVCVVVRHMLTAYSENFILCLCIGFHSKVPWASSIISQHEITSVSFLLSSLFLRLNKEIRRFFWKMAPLYFLVLLKLHPCNHGRQLRLSLVCCWSLAIRISNCWGHYLTSDIIGKECQIWFSIVVYHISCFGSFICWSASVKYET